jgi:hypothetical protein
LSLTERKRFFALENENAGGAPPGAPGRSQARAPKNINQKYQSKTLTIDNFFFSESTTIQEAREEKLRTTSRREIFF